MRWIDGQAYVGPDRRGKRGARLLERRRADYAGNAPALSTAIRQLAMRVIDAHSPEGRKAFSHRAKAVLTLAEAERNRGVGDILRGVIRKVDGPSVGDIRAQLEAELSRAALLANR